ncbi:MAG: SAM-dependent methyltransferase [Peptococcaceae bacterium]|nr:SAM-dependent methyltransferase [Peptococcaceae bacterium]
MSEWKQYVEEMVAAPINKMVLSHPKSKSEEYKKISIQKKKDFFQIEKYSDKQVFHENVKADALLARCVELIDNHYLQVNAWTDTLEYALLISKKGKCSFKKIGQKGSQKPGTKQPGGCQSGNCAVESHNRKKQYLLEEGSVIPPLVDMGIFTQEGKVVRSMYDKYRQINRFIELIDDAVRDLDVETLHVIDFGCGKSYLTFILYYYLTEIRNIRAEIIGLDLKEDVIVNCNAAAQKYGYSGLRFEMGDINGYKAPFEVDMVITLHACDTATDFALYNAIQWNAKMIFSVPCCQHELNHQMKAESLSILSNYGIIQERFAALATDAIRGNLLEYCGYKTQLLEFIDFAHTPKNILIRATLRQNTTKRHRETKLAEVHRIMDEFHFTPTLYGLVVPESERNNA